MRKMRLLTVLAAMLLSCGIANAQTEGDDKGNVTGDENAQVEITSGDVNNDGKLNIKDVTAAADSIMDGKKSGTADVYKDEKVNALDVVTVVNLIKETNYFYLGTEEPTKDNYTTLDGVVTNFKSYAELMNAAPTVKVTAGKAANFLCPSSWGTEQWINVLQNEDDGTIYELGKVETDISEYTLYRTKIIAEEVTLKLKNEAEAEEYEKSLKPNDLYFWLGNTFPTKNNFPTLGGKDVPGIVTTYTSLGEAMEKASRVYPTRNIMKQRRKLLLISLPIFISSQQKR